MAPNSDCCTVQLQKPAPSLSVCEAQGRTTYMNNEVLAIWKILSAIPQGMPAKMGVKVQLNLITTVTLGPSLAGRYIEVTFLLSGIQNHHN